MVDRSEINHSLAKAIAYKQCGRGHKARLWAARLVRQLECAALRQKDAAGHRELAQAA